MRFSLRIIVLFVIVPVLLEIVIFYLIVPPSFDINFRIECKDQSSQCRTIVDSGTLEQFLIFLKSKVDDLTRIGAISPIPSDIVRFNLRMTNNSSAAFRISDPPQVLPTEASIVCGDSLVIYDQSILLTVHAKLSDISPIISNITQSIPACRFESSKFELLGGIFTELKLLLKMFGPKIAPEGILSFSLNDFQGIYRVDFVPDWKSRFLLFIILSIAMFPLLPAFREAYRFGKNGTSYFSKQD